MAVGRFQVMAVLQAARALVLGVPEPLAKSWGLNRAIFYAAAKRGFRAKEPPPRRVCDIKAEPVAETPEFFHLGNEMALKTKDSEGTEWFIIGGKVQTEQEFARQIESRFGEGFAQAWEEALQLVRQFDQKILISQHGFFSKVYKPNRDLLAAKWTAAAK
ncbi:MAG: hypothetical protein ACFFCO_08130 [Promethearchaeota archaeon]